MLLAVAEPKKDQRGTCNLHLQPWKESQVVSCKSHFQNHDPIHFVSKGLVDGRPWFGINRPRRPQVSLDISNLIFVSGVLVQEFLFDYVVLDILLSITRPRTKGRARVESKVRTG